MKKILITPYVSPDIDGYACAYAYQEFLVHMGKDAKGGIFGIPHREVNFVLDIFDITPMSAAESIKYDHVILVDASDMNGLSDTINPNDVIEIIDHRKVHEAQSFPNAEVQIELIGAAATLIGEKFYKAKIDPSAASAALLYSAIVSNTINFKNNVTTDRDRMIAQWLLGFFTPPRDYIETMFRDKSTFKKSLKDIFNEDLLKNDFGGKTVSIFQLEIVEVRRFINSRIKEVNETLQYFKTKDHFDVIFLTCIDIFKGYNMFVTIDPFSEKVVSEAVGVKFKEGVALRKGIIMRKEIVPLIKAYLENNS